MVDNNCIWSNPSNKELLLSYNHADTADNASSRDQDHLLPIANVGRIMKEILPTNAKIPKEAKETMQECAIEFISFVTGEASDRCHKERRKTVNGDDVCWPLCSLGFNYYAESLKRFLQRYKEAKGEKVDSNQINPAVSCTPFNFNMMIDKSESSLSLGDFRDGQ